MSEVRWTFNPDRIAQHFEYRCVNCDAATVMPREGGPLPVCCGNATDYHVTALLDTEPCREYMGTMGELAAA